MCRGLCLEKVWNLVLLFPRNFETGGKFVVNRIKKYIKKWWEIWTIFPGNVAFFYNCAGDNPLKVALKDFNEFLTKILSNC